MSDALTYSNGRRRGRKLRSINSSVARRRVVADLSPRNAKALLGESIWSSCTDIFDTRSDHDVAVKSPALDLRAGVASYG